jgi:hypothetical protein
VMRTQAETAFSMALSRALPNVAIPDKDLRKLAKLAMDVLGEDDEGEQRSEDRRRAADARPVMAFDQREDGDPLSETEKALQACESFISKNITDELQRARGLELVKALMRAASAAGGAGHKLGEDRRPAADALAVRRGKQAADAAHRPSVLYRVLAGVRNPSAGGLTGH